MLATLTLPPIPQRRGVRTMPEDWLSTVLTAMTTGGILSAVFGFWLKYTGARHSQGQQVKKSEIEVLHQIISELRAERVRDRGEAERHRIEMQTSLNARNDEINDLKSEHSACLIEQERLRAEIAGLRRELRALRGERGGP